MHAGLMIVTNELPYVTSVVQAAGAGLSYDSSDPSSFAVTVGRIVADRGLTRRCQENALRFAKEAFNWQAHAETLNRPLPGIVCGPQFLRLSSTPDFPQCQRKRPIGCKDEKRVLEHVWNCWYRTNPRPSGPGPAATARGAVVALAHRGPDGVRSLVVARERMLAFATAGWPSSI